MNSFLRQTFHFKLIDCFLIIILMIKEFKFDKVTLKLLNCNNYWYKNEKQKKYKMKRFEIHSQISSFKNEKMNANVRDWENTPFLLIT